MSPGRPRTAHTHICRGQQNADDDKPEQRPFLTPRPKTMGGCTVKDLKGRPSSAVPKLGHDRGNVSYGRPGSGTESYRKNISYEEFYECGENVDISSRTSNERSQSKTSSKSRTSFSAIPLRINSQHRPLASKVKFRKADTESEGTNDTGDISLHELTPNITPRTKNSMISLEETFKLRKQEMEYLRNEICSKQRSCSEIYESLIQLKQQLESSGKDIRLPEFDLLDGGDGVSKTKSNSEQTNMLTPAIINSMTVVLKDISTFILCKRQQLNDMINSLPGISEEQQPLQNDIANKFENAPEINQELLSVGNHIILLQQTLQEKDERLEKAFNDLREKDTLINENKLHHRKAVDNLRQTIKKMEEEINQYKKLNGEHNQKCILYEQKQKQLENRLKSTETKLRKFENKCLELQKAIRY